MKASMTTLVAVLTIGSVGFVASNASACHGGGYGGGYGGYGYSGVEVVHNVYVQAPSAPTFAPGHSMIVVCPGDSWFSICSREYGTSSVWSQVANFNGMPQNLPLTIGMQLRLPVINPNGSLSPSSAPAAFAPQGFAGGIPQGMTQGIQQNGLPQGFPQGGQFNAQGAQFNQQGGQFNSQGAPFAPQGGQPQAGFAPQGQGFAPQQGQMGLPQGGQFGQQGLPQNAQLGQQGLPQGGQFGQPAGQPQGQQFAPQAPIAPQAPEAGSQNIGMVPQLDGNQPNGQPNAAPGQAGGQPVAAPANGQPGSVAAGNAAPSDRPIPSIMIGSLMSIGGQQLGNDRGMVHLIVNGQVRMLEIVEWTANAAKVKVPADLPAGAQAQIEILRADGSVVTKDNVQLAAGQNLAANNG
jgi:hypothetical protein